MVSILEQARDEIFQEGTVSHPNFILELELSLEYVGDSCRVVLGLKGRVSSNQLVNGDSECPEIDSFIISSSDVHLRRKVKLRSDDGEHIPSVSPLEGLLADAEIDDLDLLLLRVIEDVLGLYIPMADILIMNIADGGDQLFDDLPKFLLILGLEVLQALVLDVVHHQEGGSLVLVEVEGPVLDD